MRGLLIFDHLSDVLFTKCDAKFAGHVRKLAGLQGLIAENKDENEDDVFTPSANIIMQLFSPIVTSQHIMASQFSNTYTSLKCHNGTNMVFDEFMGHMFIYVSSEDVELMKKTLGICITIIRHVCGPDVSILKTSKQKVQMVSHLLDAWTDLRNYEQSILTEAVEQLSVNTELSSGMLKVLSEAADNLKAQSEFSNVHALVLVKHKFLSLFSSKNAQDLLASDILLMVLLCHVINKNKNTGDIVSVKNNKENDILMFRSSTMNEDETMSQGHLGKLSKPTYEDINNLFEGSRDSSVSEGLYIHDGHYSQIMLLGSESSGFTANAIHISEVSEGINLVIIVEMMNLTISSGLYDSFYHLNVINRLQLQRDMDELKPAFDCLESSVKKTLDGIKKNRSNVSNDVDMCQRRLQVKWDFVRKKYLELLKSRDPESVLQIESNIGGFVDALRELFRLLCLDKNFLTRGVDVITTVGRLVSKKLNELKDFQQIKDLKSNEKSSTSASINRYLDEFPGLVHFIYIDRTTHRLIATTIDFKDPENLTTLITKKIWTMVEQSRIYLQEGHMSVMWKDKIFNYAYFLWFEDSSGTPLKCKTHFNQMLKNLPIPGIFCGDYYKKLAEAYFPKLSPSKIRIYELYCVHLGLATSSCVLEHSRRLAATIWEVTGLPNNPADIL